MKFYFQKVSKSCYKWSVKGCKFEVGISGAALKVLYFDVFSIMKNKNKIKNELSIMLLRIV